MMGNEQKSIAFFIHDLAGGGVELMRLRLIDGLLSRGYDVTLILQLSTGPLLDRLPSALRVVVLEKARVVQSVTPLIRALNVLKPDFLVSSLDHNNICALSAGLLVSRRTKVVVCQHNALSAERAMGWRYRLVPALYRLLSKQAYAFVAVSNGVALDMAEATGIRRNRITVISNPVIRADFQPPALALDHPWAADDTVPLFVFIGRLVAQKDPHTLLAAFALFAGRQPGRLAILGEGPLRGVLEQQAASFGIASRVLFVGFVNDPRPWLSAARALLLTSRYEGFGNVIVEALAHGTPVIATDCPHGPAEILGYGQYGVLVEVGDAAALAVAMSNDMRADFPRERLAGRAAAFSVERCVEGHEEIFKRPATKRTPQVFGLDLSNLDAAAVADRCLTVQPERLQLVVTPNLDHVRLLRQADFCKAYENADIICPDGLPVAIYAWLRSGRLPKRVTGCEIVHHLFHHAALGAQRVTAVVEDDTSGTHLRDWLAYRGLQDLWLVIVAPPRLRADNEAQSRLAHRIEVFAPQVLLMTLGAPTSELFVHRNRAGLPACWVLCVGQAVRVEIGAVRRAPAPLRGAGLEWAWRMLQEPRRLLPRYCKAAAWFPIAISADLFIAFTNGRRGLGRE